MRAAKQTSVDLLIEFLDGAEGEPQGIYELLQLGLDTLQSIKSMRIPYPWYCQQFRHCISTGMLPRPSSHVPVKSGMGSTLSPWTQPAVPFQFLEPHVKSSDQGRL